VTYTSNGQNYESVPIEHRSMFNWHSGFRDWVRPVGRKVPIDTAFVEQLIKRCAEADDIFRDSGRIRLQAAIEAALDLHQSLSAGRTTQGGK
jgi:hypothetical protein